MAGLQGQCWFLWSKTQRSARSGTSWSLAQQEAVLGVCAVATSVRSSSSQLLALPVKPPQVSARCGQNDHGPGPGPAQVPDRQALSSVCGELGSGRPRGQVEGCAQESRGQKRNRQGGHHVPKGMGNPERLAQGQPGGGPKDDVTGW